MTTKWKDGADLTLFVWPFFGYAPGNYASICVHCHGHVINVDKRALSCLPCAMEAAQKAVKEAQDANHR